MCRAFQPFTMQGIYFSLKTSFQIKISPFHLLASYRVTTYLVRKTLVYDKKNHSFCFTPIVDKPKKNKVIVIVEKLFFR